MYGMYLHFTMPLYRAYYLHMTNTAMEDDIINVTWPLNGQNLLNFTSLCRMYRGYKGHNTLQMVVLGSVPSDYSASLSTRAPAPTMTTIDICVLSHRLWTVLCSFIGLEGIIQNGRRVTLVRLHANMGNMVRWNQLHIVSMGWPSVYTD